MHTIPWIADIEALSGFELTAVGMMVLVSAWGAGFLADNAMGQAGLGPVINAVVTLIGAFAGLYLRYAYIHPPADLDVVVTLGFAALTPALLLLAIGVIRGRLF
ncbi:MAG TPA: hypothetical protein VEK35_09160 [Roseiarcus sp.]|nr:hypothetical protein [Roseiarcus sp.]